MKKNYFFGAVVSLLLVMFALPANAQVASLADLFGKYQFTADMTVAPGMEAKAEQLSANCEAVIESDPIYDAHIVGFAGSTETMYINAISTEKEMIKVTNRNTPQLFDGLYLSDETGRYPYAIWEGSTEVEAALGALYMSYNPTTKEITIPEFTVVTCDHANSKATVVATFKNAKMTFVEEEVIEAADLSGSWHATPLGTFGSNSESTIAGEYDFVLTKTGEDNTNYNAELTIAGFNPITLPATFDGVTLSIQATNVVLDETTGATIYYNGSTDYAFTFTYASENVLSMSTPLAIAVPTQAEDENGEPIVKYEMLQWYMNGSAKRGGDEPEVTFSWAGTWTVKATENMSQTSAEFDMVIEYNEGWGMYLITEFMGKNVVDLNYGGILIEPSADGKTATIETGVLIESLGEGNFSYLYDSYVGTDPINVTVNADGTLSIDNFSVATNAYGAPAADAQITAFYTGVTASMPSEEEAVEFDWAGTWTVKATENMSQTPAEFDMVVEYNEGWGMYLITEFMGNDVVNLNYGGILLTPSADGKSATIETGSIIKSLGEGNFSYLYDSYVGTDPINLTVNADGTLSIDDFSVATNAYGGAAADAQITAFYTGVTASKPNEEEALKMDWTGTWNIQATESISQTPAEFTMVVEYNEGWDMYLITEFMGNDVVNLNYGGILLTPSADGKSATIETGSIIKSLGEGNFSYLYDSYMGTEPIEVKATSLNELKFVDFSVATNAYGGAAADAQITAFYTNVTATKADANAIESVKSNTANVTVEGGVITIAGDAQTVQVYDAAGRLEFSGVATSISNLAKGIHIVKVGGTAVKVSVK